MPQRRPARVLADLVEPAGERLRLVKRENSPLPWVGVERVGERRLDTRRLVREREPAFDRGRHVVGHSVEVLGRLPEDAAHRDARLLGLDDSRRLTVHEEQVVSAAMRRLHQELADCDPLRRGEVDGARVLHRPACGGEHPVDLDPGLRLGSQVCELAVRHRRIFTQNPADYAGATSKRSFSVLGGTRVG